MPSFKLNTLNMYGYVVIQKLPSLYMCSNACMLAAKACLHMAHVFPDLIFMMCSALHEKGRNKGKGKDGFHQNQ